MSLFLACRASSLSLSTPPPKFQSIPAESKFLSSRFKPISKITRFSDSDPHSSKTLVKIHQSQTPKTLFGAAIKNLNLKNYGLLLQFGTALWFSIEQPVLAETGAVEEDLVANLISGGIIAFFYFLVIPPIMLNWLRQRWYKRKFVEMYLQFMCVFLFFPGILLWAPFVNFRRFPRDPSMKYPWSTPQDPSANDPASS